MTAADARRIHDSLPVVDGHNDLPWELRIRAGGDLAQADPRQHLESFHTDLPRLLDGGVGVQFWSVFVPAWTRNPAAATHEQISLVEEMSTRAPDLTALVGSAQQARQVRDGGRVAGFMGVEGGHCIEDDLGLIGDYHRRGVRYMTLTHGSNNEWADSATDEAAHGGLTAFGREVVSEMNRVGMLIDISHAAATTMRDAIDASRAPVIASHSSTYALAPHPRNLPDDVLEIIGATGGVAMITFVPAFVVAATARQALDMFSEMRELRAQFDPDDEAGYNAAYKERFGSIEIERGSVSDVVDHIEHAARVAGVDHVGIGSDFDGTEQLPEGLEDVSTYPRITEELLQRGWNEADTRKVLGDNVLRVLEDAEAMSNQP